MTRAQKRRNEQHAEALDTVLASFGAQTFPAETHHARTLATPAGLLDVTARPNEASPGASVYARFRVPDLARRLTLDSNPFSGKWNHHFWTDDVAASTETLIGVLHRVGAREP